MDVDKLVESATAESLISADYGQFMAVVDSIFSGAGKPVVIALKRRLAVRNPKTQSLALELLDCCIKNTDEQFHALAGSLAGDVASIASSAGDAAPRARKLLAEAAVSFQFHPATIPFKPHYDTLVARGVAFPPVDVSSVEVYPPRESPPEHASASAPAPAAAGRSEDEMLRQIAAVDAAFEKLQTDLRVVRRHIAAAATLAVSGVASSSHEGWLDEDDFLQQTQPRLARLVEAGINGTLDETLFESCLQINEAVARLLEFAQAVTASGGARLSGLHLSDLASFDSHANHSSNAANVPAAVTTGAAAVPVVGSAAASVATGDELSALFGMSDRSAAAPAPAAVAFAPIAATSNAVNPFDDHAPMSNIPVRTASVPTAVAAAAPVLVASTAAAPVDFNFPPSSAASQADFSFDAAPAPSPAPAPAPSPATATAAAAMLAELDSLIG